MVSLALAGPAFATTAMPSGNPLAIPITFERNDGQYPAEVLFVSRGLGGTLALRAGDLAVTARGTGPRDDALRLRLAGANLAPEVEPLAPLATRSYHYRGASRIENVPHFGELQVRDVYPGIDMALHGRDGALEYDLVVAPGADPDEIRLDLRGIEQAEIDAAGNLVLERAGERVTQHAPVAYQGEGAQRRPVEANFELVEGAEGPEARIVVGAYDTGSTLTIDPVLGYSSYVGSSGTDGAAFVQVDGTGDVYFTVGASGSGDTVVVTRFQPATNTVVYQTSFSGHPFTAANGMAVSNQTAYVVGTTNGTDFPVVPVKGNSSSDAFVAVVAPSGALTNTRLIGGSASDFGNAIAIDASGNVYVGGSTQGNLPVTTGGPLNGGAIVSPFGIMNDGFVARLDAATLSTTYLRYVGGSGTEGINAIAVDASGQAIVGGSSSFGGFPQVNVGTPASPPPTTPFSTRAFTAKVSADGASFVYAEYIGGSASGVDAVAYDASTGSSVVGGSIFGNTLIPASSRPYGGGVTDGYMVRVDSVGNPTWSSYIGGSGSDAVMGLAVDSAGTVFATGQTFSTNFPAINPLSGMSPAPARSNAFVTRFTAGTLDFASALGGSGDDSGRSLAIAFDGSLWIGGYTSSVDFPTVNPLRATRSGPSDGFIAQIPGVAAASGLGVGPPGGPPGLGGGGPPGLGGGLPPGLGGSKPNGK